MSAWSKPPVPLCAGNEMSPTWFSAMAKPLLRKTPASRRRAVAEVVEQRDAVGLGPHADRPGARDVIVVELDVWLAVEDHADARAGEFRAQGVPGVPRHRRVDVFDRDAPAALRVVQRHVVLEGIGARDVVAVAVLEAPDHAAGLVFVARHRLQLYPPATICPPGPPPSPPT